MHNINLIRSFIHAFKGLYYAVRGERNMLIHFVIAFFVILFSFLLHLEKLEFIIILICAALVLVTEMINTAFEHMVDLFHGRKIDPIIRILKDVASSAVLLASIFAAIIGIWIFSAKIF